MNELVFDGVEMREEAALCIVAAHLGGVALIACQNAALPRRCRGDACKSLGKLEEASL